MNRNQDQTMQTHISYVLNQQQILFWKREILEYRRYPQISILPLSQIIWWLSDFKTTLTTGKQTINNLELFLDIESSKYPSTSTGTKIELNQHKIIRCW